MDDDELAELIEDWPDDDDVEPATVAEREQANERSNAHIEEYLRQFIEDESAPEHAVMIAGNWGIGKSHFVTQLVDRYAKPNDQQQYVYVSLDGLQNIADIDAALAVALHPILKTKVARVVIKATGVLLQHFRVDPEVKISSIANKFGAMLYVFDDLERCEAPLQTTLGYINRFVEYGKCRVVVVANEAALRKKPDYKAIKEKIVGQSFTLQPVIAAPLRHFIDKVSSERARNILSSSSDTILKRYRQSQIDNLRVLRQATWDFARLLDQLADRHLSNMGLVVSLLDSFMLLSFEYKTGRITPELIALTGSSSSFSMLGKQDENHETWKALRERYPDSSIDERVLLGSLWVDVLVHGFIEQTVLRAACDASRYVAGKSLPSWKRLWDAFNESDEEVCSLIADVRDKFQLREYTIPGELMHVIGLHIWMAKGGLIEHSVGEFVAEAKRYIDEMYTAGSIVEGASAGGMSHSESFGGLGIQQRETPEYQEVSAYYHSQRERFVREQLPIGALGLISDLRTNPRAFIEKVCYTNGGNYIFRDVPVLATMNVDDGASALAALSGRDQQAVFASIRERYERGLINGALAPERDWLTRLRAKLLEIAASRSGFGRFRIEKMVEWSINPLLDLPNKAQPEMLA